MKFRKVFSLPFTPVALLLVALFVASSKSEDAFKHTNIILIGATGDLAEKYLWRSLFEFFSEHYVKGKHMFSIYGCSRKTPTEGREFMSDILLKVILCPGGDDNCKGKKMKFVEAIQYHQLKTEKHYKALAEKINENIQSMYGMQGTPNSPEDGRLVYLSIPPSAYPKTSQMVNQYLRPKVGRPWFRVVIEKPFGHSLESAKSLLDKMKNSFTPQELYRIDHYLGKKIVQEILPFRYRNRELYEPIWNRHHIERVEVVMKERINVQGRTTFYNEVGVIRDVMQNHLTEMAILIGMDLPRDSGLIKEILASKVQFLNQVEPLTESSIVLGQYSTYSDECSNELPKLPKVINTPTYAAAVLSVNNDRWRGVPFVLMSGKKLDEKFSYVRVIFKEDKFQLKHTSASSTTPRQIVFQISTGNIMHPAKISISKSLPKPKSKDHWKVEENTDNRFYFGESSNDAYEMTPLEETESYTTLIEAVYQGYRHMFVDSQSLLLSWKIWNNVVSAAEKRRPRIYEGGKGQSELLDFRILNSRALEFIHKDKEIHVEAPDAGSPEIRQIPATFRDRRLSTGVTDKVIENLANDIRAAASEAVMNRGVFHLVLAGGQSPVLLFRHLVTYPGDFPWESTHVWQLDERCVAQDQSSSNFNLIYTHLLRHVPIPYLNIHPMPVDISCEPCSRLDNGDNLYDSLLVKYVANTTLDFVLIGVGYDGHVASLFPNQTSLDESEKYVIYSQAGAERLSPNRMTLTFPIINKARNLAVIILGKKKHELIDTLANLENSDDFKTYPILGLTPSENSEMTWYIDSDALFGDSNL